MFAMPPRDRYSNLCGQFTVRERSSVADLAVLIKTCFRDEALYQGVASIRQHCKGIDYRLYIADDGPTNPEKQSYYDRLRDEGHCVLELPFNTGASRCRNLLLEHLAEEKYVLRLDDDFHFCAETNLHAMKAILENDVSIGAVADLERQIGLGKGTFSGEISPWQGYLEIKGDVLTKRFVPLSRFRFERAGGVEYARCDFSRNMLLLRRQVFDDVHWDDDLKFAGEHLDFLLQLKYSKWHLAFTTSSIHLHREDIPFGDGYEAYHALRRQNSAHTEAIMMRKWGIRRVVIRRPLGQLIKQCIIRVRRMIL